MKKSAVMLLILLVLCMTLLIGCHAPTEQPDGGDTPVSNEPDTEAPGADATEPERVDIDGTVRVELDAEAYDGQGKTLPLRIINATEADITYGYAFAVEKKQGDAWVNAMKDAVGFPEPMYIVPSGIVTVRNVNLTSYCEISSAGTYRYRMDIGSGGNVQTYTVEFDVK